MADHDLGKLKIDRSPAPAVRGKRYGKLVWTVVIIVGVVLALVFSGLLTPKVEVEASSVSLVQPSQGYTLLTASGYVVAQRKAAVAAKATGRLVWLGVEEGSSVKKGQVIARLESQDVQASRAQANAGLSVSRHGLEQAGYNAENARAAVAQAEAELTDARRSIDRTRELLARGIVAKADMDAAEARYKRAVAGVDGAKSSVLAAESAKKSASSQIDAAKAGLIGADVALEYTQIRAPFDAVVLTKNADIGDIVTPLGAAANAKAAVVTIADMSSLEVEADVSESSITKIRPGGPCEVQLDAIADQRFVGVVSAIVPTADRSKASILVKVRFDKIDPRILPEMSAKVSFLSRPVGPDESAPRIAVSPAAVISRDKKQFAYRIVDGKAVETQVTVGAKLGDFIEVTNGLKPGDKVAITNLGRLKNGVKVKVAEQ